MSNRFVRLSRLGESYSEVVLNGTTADGDIIGMASYHGDDCEVLDDVFDL